MVVHGVRKYNDQLTQKKGVDQMSSHVRVNVSAIGHNRIRHETRTLSQEF